MDYHNMALSKAKEEKVIILKKIEELNYEVSNLNLENGQIKREIDCLEKNKFIGPVIRVSHMMGIDNNSLYNALNKSMVFDVLSLESFLNLDLTNSFKLLVIKNLVSPLFDYKDEMYIVAAIIEDKKIFINIDESFPEGLFGIFYSFKRGFEYDDPAEYVKNVRLLANYSRGVNCKVPLSFILNSSLNYCLVEDLSRIVDILKIYASYLNNRKDGEE